MKRRLVFPLVALAVLELLHAALLPLVDRYDLVSASLALSADEGLAVIAVLLLFLVLRVFAYVIAPALALIVVMEASVHGLRARAARRRDALTQPSLR